MQLGYQTIFAHTLLFVVSVWIIKRGFEGSLRRGEPADGRDVKRPLISPSSLPLRLVYIVLGMAAAILTVTSFLSQFSTEPDLRVLQLALVVLVLWLMTNVVANRFLAPHD